MNKGKYIATQNEDVDKLQLICRYTQDYEAGHSIPDDVEIEILYRGRNRLYELRLDGTSYVVKAFARQPWLIRLAGSLGLLRSKAERSHRYAEDLERRGIGVAHSVGYALIGGGLVYDRAYHISHKLEADVPHIQPHARGWASPEGFAEALAKFLVRLHERGVQHLDLSPGNVLYHQDATGAYHFFLVDLNRMQLYDRPLEIEPSIRNMARLMNTNSTTRRLAYYYALARGLDTDATIASLSRETDLFWSRRYLKLCRRYAKGRYGTSLWAFIRMYIRYRLMLHRGEHEEAALLYRKYLQREDIRHIERRARSFDYQYV